MIRHLHNQLISKEFSATELTKKYLERIEKLDQKIYAFLTVTVKIAMDQARAVDEKIAQGKEIATLAGIPSAIKDNIATRGTKTTAASRILENYVPPFDAMVVKRLKERDYVLVGKTNLDEFAHGSSTENSAFWPTHNPWNLERVPGGSSGGSGAAVAGDLAVYALGTDTGGSVRCPASYCGITGLKPSYGRCSRYGLFSMTSSTDVPGLLAHSVEDAAYVLSALAGRDAKDATTRWEEPDDYVSRLQEFSVKGMRIGLPQEYFVKGLDKEVEEAVKKAIALFQEQGAFVKEVSLPHTSYGIAVYYIITPSEISSNLARYDGIRYGLSKGDEADNLLQVYERTRGAGFGAEAKRRIMIGTYALSAGYYDAYYKKAQQVRTLIVKDFRKIFEEVDVLITPTTPSVAFKLGEKANDPLSLYLEDIFVIPASLAGLPALSLPCGFNREGMPIGMQIIGRELAESTLLQVGAYYQNITDWHTRRPQLD